LAGAGSGLCVAAAFFFAVDLGGTVSGEMHVLSAVAAAWWASPLFMFSAIVHARALALVGAVVMNLVSAGLLVAVFTDSHSTAAIGVLTLPMALWVVALICGVVDFIYRRMQ
jgi:hypothetical protein